MSKEKITIEDFAGYLPYGLKLYNKQNIIRILGFNYSDSKEINIGDVTSLNYMPILYPLSDLIKEIEHNGERFVPIDLLGSELTPVDYFEDTDHYEYLLSWINSKDKSHHIQFLPYGLIQQLKEWKFDIKDLIVKGLAIPVTKDFNPYK